MATTRTEHLAIRSSEDVVRVRQQTRTFAVAAGLSLVDQTKIITAASELARNTLDYGGGGEPTLKRPDAGFMAGRRPDTCLRCTERHSEDASGYGYGQLAHFSAPLIHPWVSRVAL